MGNGRSAEDDTRVYREGYPDKVDDPSMNDNYRFYNNEISAAPNRDTIEDFHKYWWGEYARLEAAHDYIQWLFPIRERGMNWAAPELQKHEAEKMQQSPVIQARLMTSYKLILDFWGMVLKDESTGEIGRGDNWKKQVHNLNWHPHNHLRITRVLKWLGEIGKEHYKEPWLTFLVKECFETGELDAQNSCERFWIHTLKNDEQRAALAQYCASKHPQPRHAPAVQQVGPTPMSTSNDPPDGPSSSSNPEL